MSFWATVVFWSISAVMLGVFSRRTEDRIWLVLAVILVLSPATFMAGTLAYGQAKAKEFTEHIGPAVIDWVTDQTPDVSPPTTVPPPAPAASPPGP